MQQTTIKCRSANPVAYMESGNHASFPCRLCIDLAEVDGRRSRSAGVQSTTDHKSGKQDSEASGCQTREVSSRSRPLVAKSGETEGGLYKNHSSNTKGRAFTIAMSGGILVNALLAERCYADSSGMLLNAAEN